MINASSGGTHPENGRYFQEFMRVPAGAESLSSALRMASEVFHTLKELLKEKGLATGVGDEGGFAPNLPNNTVALDFLRQALERAGYRPREDAMLALDPAASGGAQAGRPHRRPREGATPSRVEAGQRRET